MIIPCLLYIDYSKNKYMLCTINKQYAYIVSQQLSTPSDYYYIVPIGLQVTPNIDYIYRFVFS